MLTTQEIQSWVSLWIQKSTYLLLRALKCVPSSILLTIQQREENGFVNFCYQWKTSSLSADVTS